MPPRADDLRGWHTLEVSSTARMAGWAGQALPSLVTRHSQEWDSGSRGESVRTHCKGTRLLDGTSHGTCAMCTQHRLGFHHRAAPDGGSWARPARVSLRGPVGGVDARWPWARGHSVLGWHRTISILHTSPQHPLVSLPCLVRPLPRVGTRPCSLRALGSA